MTVLDYGAKGEFPFQCVSLQDALSNLSACDLLKMDIEGDEYDVFENTPSSALKKVKAIVMEYHDWHKSHWTTADLIDFLESRDFHVNKNEHSHTITAFRT
jgi:hypothetical protein